MCCLPRANLWVIVSPQTGERGKKIKTNPSVSPVRKWRDKEENFLTPLFFKERRFYGKKKSKETNPTFSPL